MSALTTRFISQRIRPATGTMEGTSLARGTPALPSRFETPEGQLDLGPAMESWTESGPCRHGSDERYTRRHWFRAPTGRGTVARIYFERQARRSNRPCTSRWYWYSEETLEP